MKTNDDRQYEEDKEATKLLGMKIINLIIIRLFVLLSTYGLLSLLAWSYKPTDWNWFFITVYFIVGIYNIISIYDTIADKFE